MATDVWGALRAAWVALPKALADFRANKPLPAPAVGVSGPSLADALEEAQVLIPELLAALRAYPGVINGVDDLLEALDSAGVSWAAPLHQFLLDSPQAFQKAEQLLSLAAEFKAAPNPFPGMGPRIGRG